MDNYKIKVITNSETIETVENELIQPAGNKVLVKVDACAICTLEQRVFNGTMKMYPFAGGHEAAGIIVSVGDKVKTVVSGDKVAVRLLNSCGVCYYCRSGSENQCIESFKANTHEGFSGPGGFAEYMLLEDKQVFKMADDCDLTHASLAEPLACCVHSIRNANIELSNDVVVVGVGIMGAMHIKLAKLCGARVIATEISDERLELAKKMGADDVINSSKENAVERVKELTQSRGADAVFCTAALHTLAADSIQMGGKLSRVVMYSSFHPDVPVELNVNKLHSNEMIITGALNPKVDDFQIAARLISQRQIDMSLIISGVYKLEDLTDAIRYASNPSTYRVIIRP